MTSRMNIDEKGRDPMVSWTMLAEVHPNKIPSGVTGRNDHMGWSVVDFP
jgi:hypothetical protein